VAIVSEIAEAKGIPKSFLAKILQKLVDAKIVKSFKGMKGGFQLVKKPVDISLLDVVEAIEGPVAMNICAVDRGKCRFSGECAVHPVWVDIRRDVEERLKKWNFSLLSSVHNNKIK
jgi:Rrf2 family protein